MHQCPPLATPMVSLMVYVYFVHECNREMDTIIFADAHQKPSVLVPVVRATPDALIGYGRLVSDFDAEDIIRVTWPKSTGSRPVVPGTGNRQVNVSD